MTPPVKPAARRGRPPKITQAAIVDAAIDLGLDGFSMDAIADRLNVTTPALYTHVEGRDDVIRLAAATLIVDAVPTIDEHSDWVAWLEAWAEVIRDRLAGVGGNIIDAIQGETDVDTLGAAASGLQLLTNAGLSAGDAGNTLWLVTRVAFTAGAAGTAPVSDLAAATAANPAAGATHSDVLDDAMTAVAGAEANAAFRFDLDVVIAGVRARLDRGNTPST